MRDSEFQEFLHSIPTRQYSSERDFVEKIVPEFCEHLGINSNYIFYEAFLSDKVISDAIISESTGSTPWMTIEVKMLGGESMISTAQAQQQWKASNAKYGVGLRPNALVVVHQDGIDKYVLSVMSEGDAGKLRERLSPPEEYFKEQQENTFNETEAEIEDFNSEYFQLEYDEFLAAYESLESAESPQEKGDSFENLAEVLFEAVPCLTVREPNLHYNTGEIDLVVEYLGHDELTIFDKWGRYFLVECKNWKDSVGVSQIRDFYGKMNKTQVRLGVLFAREGISGDGGTNAVRWIQDYYQREGKMILVIGDRELRQLKNGKTDFYSILDSEMFQRRFVTDMLR